MFNQPLNLFIATLPSTGTAILEFSIIAIIVVVGILTNLNQNRNRQERSLELQSLAERLAFEKFCPGRDDGFAMGWRFVNQLSQGSNRYASDVLQGKYQNCSLFVFDYHYQIESGKSKTDHNLTMLMLVGKDIFPQMTIGPESYGEKIAEAMGMGGDIKFESAEFSRIFSVRSDDKKFAYDVCNPQMIEFLLANPDLQIEIQGPVILLAFEPQLPVEQIEFDLQRLAQVHSFFPKYLFSQNT